MLKQLRLQRDLYREQHSGYAGASGFIQEAVEERPDLARDARLWEAARRFGEITREAYSQWLDETIALIEAEF